MKTSSFFLFALLLLVNTNYCSCSDNIRKLKHFKTIELQENENVIITDITNVSLDSKSERAIISDDLGRTVALYDISTGKIIKNFDYGPEFSDSLARKGTHYNKQNKYVGNDFIINKYGNKEGKHITYKHLSNESLNGIFISDSTVLITANMNCFYIPESSQNNFQKIESRDKINVALTCAVIEENINSGKTNLIPYENKMHAFAQGYSMIFDDNSNNIIALSNNTHHVRKYNRYDSLWVLGVYDYTGKLDSLMMTLPEEYTTTGIGYSIYYPKLIYNRKKELICIFPICEKIYNLTKNEIVTLQNLKPSNYTYFDLIKKGGHIFDEFLNRNLYFLPNGLQNIDLSDEGNYLISIYQYKIEKDTIFPRKKMLIQEYTPPGKLLNQYHVDLFHDDGILSYIKYDPVNRLFLAFRKSKIKGWNIHFLRKP